MTGNKSEKPKGVPLDALFIDHDAIEHGEWVDNIKGAPGVRVRCRGWNCADAVARREELMSKRAPEFVEGSDEFEDLKATDPVGHAKSMRDLNSRERGIILSEICILDWTGIGEIPFSEKNLSIVCTREEAIPFRNILMNAALTCGDMRNRREESQLKNFVDGLGISFASAEPTQTA